ncbi:hypothetical protein ACIA8R_31375 [Nonomuraea sp. NPDC051191]|uniref:hypothetical protein n=1 Tax=Nonomuraea sp. NPDC051191 TaxID=3364372 RepID=UPI0037AAFDA6
MVELDGGTLVGTATLWGIDTHHRSAHIGPGPLPRNGFVREGVLRSSNWARAPRPGVEAGRAELGGVPDRPLMSAARSMTGRPDGRSIAT